MTEMVRVAVAGDVTEAEEIQEILRSAGIDAELGDGEDDSVTVSVPEDSVERAQDAIEAMTEPDEIVEAAWGADVLVTEATFSEEERDRAEETKHQTATQAAQLAQRANAGLLALTHLSNRYFGPEIAREAREIFPETVVPRDFDVIEVPFAERGTPQLVKGGATRRREHEVVSSAPE